MSRRWAPPRPSTPQMSLLLEKNRFAPPIKSGSDTSAEAAASVGMFKGGDLAASLLGVIERKTARTRLGKVMFALEVRSEVYQYLVDHPEGATADEIAYALRYSILTVRPRVSELYNKLKKIQKSDVRRPNQSGRNAVVWVIV